MSICKAPVIGAVCQKEMAVMPHHNPDICLLKHFKLNSSHFFKWSGD